MVLNFFKKTQAVTTDSWKRLLSTQGVVVQRAIDGALLTSDLLTAYLAQLIDDGFATQTIEDEFVISWESLFKALRSPGYSQLAVIFDLPPFTSCGQVLQSRNSLTDTNFSIAISWRSSAHHNELPKIIGAMLVWDEQTELMLPEHWELFSEVIEFARRPSDQCNEKAHRLAWGRIRSLALKACATLDDFLHRSVVLTPERLEIRLRKSNPVADDSVIEIEPTFFGAPPDWLERFDNSRIVLDRYDIVTPEGIVQILITPQVKTVLQEIKRLPLRRVAGSRAQAFILNPYATLGPDAKNVIDEEQFERSRECAGIQYERFCPVIERDSIGHPLRIGVLIESATATGPIVSETEWLTDDDLANFVARLETSLNKEFQLMGWNGYDLELQGETPRHLDELRSALEQRRNPAAKVSYAQIHDLSCYSPRILGIGIEKVYYSPYIAKKTEDDGWFPENVIPLIVHNSEGNKEPIAIPATKAALEQLRKALTQSEVAGQEVVELPWLPGPMPIKDAKDIVGIFDD